MLILGENGENRLVLGDDKDNEPMNIEKLPLELLREILRAYISKGALLSSRWNYSRDRKADAKILLAKFRLLAVSRSWYRAGMDLVYEDVLLPDRRRARLFLDSMTFSDSSSVALGRLTKTLVLAGWKERSMEEGLGYRLKVDALQRLLGLCPNLLSFALVPDEHMPHQLHVSPRYLFPHPLNHPRIKSLKISLYALLKWRVSTFDGFANTLEEFTLDNRSIRVHESSSSFVRARSNVVWPTLTWLRVWDQNNACVEDIFSDERWSTPAQMPSLERMSLHLQRHPSITSFKLLTPLKYLAFLEEPDKWYHHSQTLPDFPTPDFLERLVGACPKLQHLVLGCNCPSVQLSSISHSVLKSIDIWFDAGVKDFLTAARKDWDSDGRIQVTIDAVFERCTNLKSFRFFEKGLLDTEAFVDLPATISPEKYGGSKDCDARRLSAARG
ncbi:hypothetical protein AAF712_010821 [Marasmius tenuissimus]|uniref:F-box domain-containing protein n=1 Tax=Marasmius tenuissimus TaxID=585030 RepID=A0ABR2ZPM5_9AGAR